MIMIFLLFFIQLHNFIHVKFIINVFIYLYTHSLIYYTAYHKPGGRKLEPLTHPGKLWAHCGV